MGIDYKSFLCYRLLKTGLFRCLDVENANPDAASPHAPDFLHPRFFWACVSFKSYLTQLFQYNEAKRKFITPVTWSLMSMGHMPETLRPVMHNLNLTTIGY